MSPQSNMTFKLPIESKPELLQEFGRAFAYLINVEGAIGTAIRTKGELKNKPRERRLELSDQMTLGMKIKSVEKMFSEKLINELKELNEKRILLAHGVIMKGEDESLLIDHKLKCRELDKEFLIDIINSSKILRKKVIEEICAKNSN